MESVKNIRDSTGLSQKAFAEKYHIPKRTIENWEGKKAMPPEYVIELLKYRVENDRG